MNAKLLYCPKTKMKKRKLHQASLMKGDYFLDKDANFVEIVSSEFRTVMELSYKTILISYVDLMKTKSFCVSRIIIKKSDSLDQTDPRPYSYQQLFYQQAQARSPALRLARKPNHWKAPLFGGLTFLFKFAGGGAASG